MLNTVDNHYAEHLGPIYTWMIGDIDSAFTRSGAEIDALPLPFGAGGTAVDLGAGFGLHAIPLARRGYSVVAIDTYEPLLKDLEARRGSLPIHTIGANLLKFRAHIAAPVDVIMCMGDTLTHLPSPASVETLFKDVASSLVPGGWFVTTFRDYVSAPLQDDARFILVRADRGRILSCFLEYEDTKVIVHDLLHQREGESWRLRVSSYPKLRLAPQWIAERLNALGFIVCRDSTGAGMTRIAARTREPRNDPTADAVK